MRRRPRRGRFGAPSLDWWAFGLALYHEYRSTHDVEAWWRQPVSREDRDAIVAVIEGVWPGGLGLDSFDELVASKMSALVECGAPRDFRDIHFLCEAGLCNAARCCQLWETRSSGRRRLAFAPGLRRISQRELPDRGQPLPGQTASGPS